jgi:hypothetical protein
LFEQKIRTEFAIFDAANVATATATATWFATTTLEIAIAILPVRLRLRYFCVWSKKCGEKIAILNQQMLLLYLNSIHHFM